jgi:small subunit ribosomal protein S4
MAKYLGSKFKITRRLGNLVGLTHLANKCIRWYKRPGQHGRFEDYTFPKRLSDYEKTLIEKQKVKRYYGLREVQLLKYVRCAYKRKSIKGRLLISELEYRLDNVLFRSGIAYSIRRARQFITHKHVLVNGKTVNSPSFSCADGDVLTFKQKPKTLLWVSNSYMKDPGNPWDKRLWNLYYPSSVKNRQQGRNYRHRNLQGKSSKKNWKQDSGRQGFISHKPSFLKVEVFAIPSDLNQKMVEIYKTRKFTVDRRGPVLLTKLYPVDYKQVYNTVKITVSRHLTSIKKRDVLLKLDLLKVFEFYGRRL